MLSEWVVYVDGAIIITSIDLLKPFAKSHPNNNDKTIFFIHPQIFHPRFSFVFIKFISFLENLITFLCVYSTFSAFSYLRVNKLNENENWKFLWKIFWGKLNFGELAIFNRRNLYKLCIYCDFKVMAVQFPARLYFIWMINFLNLNRIFHLFVLYF